MKRVREFRAAVKPGDSAVVYSRGTMRRGPVLTVKGELVQLQLYEPNEVLWFKRSQIAPLRSIIYRRLNQKITRLVPGYFIATYALVMPLARCRRRPCSEMAWSGAGCGWGAVTEPSGSSSEDE